MDIVAVLTIIAIVLSPVFAISIATIFGFNETR